MKPIFLNKTDKMYAFMSKIGFSEGFFLDKTAGKQYVKANREPSLTLKGENANGLFLLR